MTSSLPQKKQRTERVTKRILTEEEMSALSDRLMQVTKGMTITVRYFKEDTAHPEIPAVGNYVTLTGKADRIDPVFRTLQVGDTVVPFEDLVEVSGEGYHGDRPISRHLRGIKNAGRNLPAQAALITVPICAKPKRTQHPQPRQ